MVKEWVKFSKADEQASVKPSKWGRWSEATKERGAPGEEVGSYTGIRYRTGQGAGRCRSGRATNGWWHRRDADRTKDSGEQQ